MSLRLINSADNLPLALMKSVITYKILIISLSFKNMHLNPIIMFFEVAQICLKSIVCHTFTSV